MPIHEITLHSEFQLFSNYRLSISIEYRYFKHSQTDKFNTYPRSGFKCYPLQRDTQVMKVAKRWSVESVFRDSVLKYNIDITLRPYSVHVSTRYQGNYSFEHFQCVSCKANRREETSKIIFLACKGKIYNFPLARYGLGFFAKQIINVLDPVSLLVTFVIIDIFKIPCK